MEMIITLTVMVISYISLLFTVTRYFMKTQYFRLKSPYLACFGSPPFWGASSGQAATLPLGTGHKNNLKQRQTTCYSTS